MFRNYRFLARSALTAALLMSVGLVGADTQTGNKGTITDKLDEFKAKDGTITTVDTTNNGIDGPPLVVVDGDPSPELGPLWQFRVKHKTSSPHWNGAGARNVQICLESVKGSRTVHWHGPHDKVDKDENIIPGGCTAMFNVNFGATVRVRNMYFRDEHETTTSAKHYDHVLLNADVTATLGVGGANNTLSGKFWLNAKHTDSHSRPRFLALHTFGSSDAQGTLVSYDAPSGELSFNVGAIDILQTDGQWSGIAPPFVSDPLLGGQIQLGPFPLFGQDPEGNFFFGGGPVTIDDPAGGFGVEIQLEELQLKSVDPVDLDLPELPNWAAVLGLRSEDNLEDADGASPYLRAFVEENLGGEGLPGAEWVVLDGIQLGFWSTIDIVAATNNFTTSASVPATVVLSGAFSPPEVPAPAVSDGRTGTPLLVDKISPDGSDLAVYFDDQSCEGGAGHHILYGGKNELPNGLGDLFGGPLPYAVCGLGLSSPIVWTGSPSPPVIDPEWEMLWFLLVGDDRVSTEGPWGAGSNLGERNGTGPNGSSGRCGMQDKDLTNSCQPGCPPVDFWATSFDEPTQIQFGNEIPPIPPNFFFPGSQPFVGQIELRGVPDSSNYGTTDTRVERFAPIDLGDDPIGTIETTEIQIVDLHLTGCQPLNVQPNGDQWLMAMGLAEGQPPGLLQAEKTSANGGSADAIVPVQPRLVFAREQDLQLLEQGQIPPDQVQVRILDFNEQGLPPVDFVWPQQMPFSTEPPADGSFFCPDESFFPGVDPSQPEGPGGPCLPGTLPPLVPPVPTATAMFLCRPPVEVPGVCTYELMDTVPSWVNCKARDTVKLNHGGFCPPYVIEEQNGDVSTCVAFYALVP